MNYINQTGSLMHAVMEAKTGQNRQRITEFGTTINENEGGIPCGLLLVRCLYGQKSKVNRS
jgi:hypothetical protein